MHTCIAPRFRLLRSTQKFCCFHEGKWDAPISERVFPIAGQANLFCTNSGAPYAPLRCFTTKCIDATKASCFL
jgi:hypothetical protein